MWLPTILSFDMRPNRSSAMAGHHQRHPGRSATPAFSRPAWPETNRWPDDIAVPYGSRKAWRS